MTSNNEIRPKDAQYLRYTQNTTELQDHKTQDDKIMKRKETLNQIIKRRHEKPLNQLMNL